MKINPENVKGCGPSGIYDWGPGRHKTVLCYMLLLEDFYIYKLYRLIYIYILHTHNIYYTIASSSIRAGYIEIYRFGSARLSDRFHLYNDMGRPHIIISKAVYRCWSYSCCCTIPKYQAYIETYSRPLMLIKEQIVWCVYNRYRFIPCII